MPPNQALLDTLTPAQRLEMAVGATSRLHSANINSAYVFPKAEKLKRQSEYYDNYRPQDVVANKTHNLRKDGLKEYVERALQLHDARGGMPVVASPIWAPKAKK